MKPFSFCQFLILAFSTLWRECVTTAGRGVFWWRIATSSLSMLFLYFLVFFFGSGLGEPTLLFILLFLYAFSVPSVTMSLWYKSSVYFLLLLLLWLKDSFSLFVLRISLPLWPKGSTCFVPSHWPGESEWLTDFDIKGTVMLIKKVLIIDCLSVSQLS